MDDDAPAARAAFPLRACLIVDGGRVTAWQYAALELAVDQGLVTIAGVLDCGNTHTAKDLVRHAGYYAIRALLMRPKAMAMREVGPLIPAGAPVVAFESDWEGMWQRIPAATIEAAAGHDFDVGIKFGMNLLRDPDHFPARHGVLSFHHGDPAQFRGRPAGFYELATGAKAVGAVVQQLTNRLDGGRIWAFGRFKIHPHSYRQTLQSVLWGSRRLLPIALRNLAAGQRLKVSRKGTNYRLPGNLTAAAFLANLMWRKAARLAYGAVFEKRWRLFRTEVLTDLAGETVLKADRPIVTPGAFSFLADGFLADGAVVCEGLDRRTGLGVVLRLEEGEARRMTARGHASYPHPVRVGEETWIVPEVAGWSAPFAVRLNGEGWEGPARPLRGLEHERVLDPTLFEAEGRYWLFGTRPESGADQLWLWSAADFDGPYEPHSMNPVVIDPARARPAGPVRRMNGALVRLGQDNSGGYGESLTVCVIETLSAEAYGERVVGTVRADALKGPHTLDMDGDGALFDAYEDVFYPLAGWNRLRARLSARRRVD